MPQLLKTPITAGITSAMLFVLLSMLGFNSLFLMFSAIPLFYIGYSLPFAPTVIAGAVASFILLLFNPYSSLFYIAAIAVPCFFILAHRLRTDSLIPAMAELCGYAMVLASTVQLATIDQGGIPGGISKAFDLSQAEAIDPKLALQMQWLMGEGSYLLIGMIAWWAVMFLILSMWLTTKLPKGRDNQSVGQFSTIDLPAWPLVTLLLSIGIGFLAPDNIRFLGLLGFVIMLLPYVFVGAMNTPLKKALGAGLGWALVTSVCIMVLAWPAIFVAAFGVLKHTQQLIMKE